MMPGDPIANLVGEDIYLSEETKNNLRSTFGLDHPLHVQFFMYCSHLISLDLGYSYHMHNAVSGILADRVWWTLMYIGISIAIGAWIGIYLGGWAGYENTTWRSRLISACALVISSTPPYLLSLLAMAIFVYHLGWFPFKGFYDTLQVASIVHHLILPITILSLFYAARNILIMRGAVLSEKVHLYPLFARALGIPEKEILYRYIKKNAIIPLINLISLDFGFLFSGALFIEIVFSLNGMGSLMYDAILSRDYPVLTGTFLIISFFVMCANFIADILTLTIDPRTRSQS